MLGGAVIFNFPTRFPYFIFSTSKSGPAMQARHRHETRAACKITSPWAAASFGVAALALASVASTSWLNFSGCRELNTTS
jgi:hypothetical protein